MHSSRIAAPNASARCALLGDVGVVQDERVHVAVAGMEHVGAAQLELLRQDLRLPENMRQRPPWNRAVDAIVIRRDPANRGKRRLPAGPEQQPLALVLRHANPGGPGRGEHARDLRHVRRHFLGRAIGLDEQNRRRVERIAGMHELLDRARRGPVHHFEPRRHDPGADDRGHRGAGSAHIRKGGERHLRRLRLGGELDRDFGGDGEQALGPVDERQQIVAGAVQGVAAELDDLAA